MTPAARVAAAIDVLDRIGAGDAAERALTNWARGHRFAGSKDRAAIRDHVFDALRCRRSYAALGGAETGRGLMIGAIRAAGGDPRQVFTGDGYAPPALGPDETVPGPALAALPAPVRLDVPDWIHPELQRDLGDDLEPTLLALRTRAPVFLRVNRLKADHGMAAAALVEDDIDSEPHPLAATARLVTRNARRIRQSRAYLGGLVELQDAASQAAVAALEPVASGRRVLDYCAGGGGKALALAAMGAEVAAHDADPGRMADLPARAARAGARIERIASADARHRAPWDLVLVDAPCSGSGAWRRQAEAKWRLTRDALARLIEIQAGILGEAAALVAPGGVLAYATCSLLDAENGAQIRRFLDRQRGWTLAAERRLLPADGGDGFYIAQLTPRGGA